MTDKEQGKVGSAKRNFLQSTLAIVGSGGLFGLAFWLIWGHDLHYNVYSNGELWYREEFPLYFKLIATTLTSLTSMVVVALVVRTVKGKKRNRAGIR